MSEACKSSFYDPDIFATAKVPDIHHQRIIMADNFSDHDSAFGDDDQFWLPRLLWREQSVMRVI
jgi:hypothetical protein